MNRQFNVRGAGVNVPNGVPLVLGLDERLRYVTDTYLGDPNQGKKGP